MERFHCICIGIVNVSLCSVCFVAYRTPELITLVKQQCSQREKYVNYLRKLDQQLCHHDSQMDRTQSLFNRYSELIIPVYLVIAFFRLQELLATSVATFTVKHFLLEQEAGIKKFTAKVKQGDMMVDDKCAVVHKYIKHYKQKLLDGPSWSSFRKYRQHYVHCVSSGIMYQECILTRL